MSRTDLRREHLIEPYRRKAKHYDVTCRLYPAPDYPQRSQRLRAVHAMESDAILSTYALSQVPECAQVIAHGAAALCEGGRWVVPDLKAPGNTPGWPARLATAVVRPFASIDEWITRRPRGAIHVAMREELADLSWTELCCGTAFLAAGTRSLGRSADDHGGAAIGGRRRRADSDATRSK